MRKNPCSWRWRRTLVWGMNNDGYSLEPVFLGGAPDAFLPYIFPWKCFPEDVFLIP